MRFVCLLFLLFSVVAKAQLIVGQVKDTTQNGGPLLFPVVGSVATPEVAERINLYIQMIQLNALMSKPKVAVDALNVFENYTYALQANNSRFFELRFSQTMCGMQCNTYETVYTFNAATGDILTLEDLLTPGGLSDIRHAAQEDWKALLRSRLKDPVHAEQYKACLDEANNVSQLVIAQFTVSANGISIGGPGCFDDDAGKDLAIPSVSKSVAQLKPLLSPDGVAFFAGGAPRRTSQLLHTVLRGKIDNKYAITLVLLPRYFNEPENAIHGLIVYNRIGKTISLKGTLDGSKAIFHEMDETMTKEVSTMECIWDGSQLIGTFKNLTTGKVLSLSTSK